MKGTTAMNCKKKVPVLKLAGRDEAAAVAAVVPAETTIALNDIAGAIRRDCWCSAARPVCW
jgi:hypothetical protein